MISKIFPSFFILILYIIILYIFLTLSDCCSDPVVSWLSDLINSSQMTYFIERLHEIIFAVNWYSRHPYIRRRFWLLILYFFLLLFLYALQILLTFRLYAFISACACAFFRWFRSGCYPVLTSEIWTKMDRINYFLRANSEFLK